MKAEVPEQCTGSFQGDIGDLERTTYRENADMVSAGFSGLRGGL